MTSTDVYYSMYYQIFNSGSTKAVAEVQYRGVDASGQEVLEGTLSEAVEANRVAAGLNVIGTPLAITTWNKISRWEIVKVTKQ